ncbi:DPP IV N-terminal domain-containing protein [Nonomuraea endophytica]|uniref:Dipeptidylpeptidase IV N-terminal domain-containing protein n=1 Tax=Nonomuraea endophytica TaxID=714136 RepID=A0A7W8AEK0_9ACTN|nr:DPP IV N-terminal domain-containing protein [Nonomuraea endophytica]MBB5084734.1 hypothetical protein [Nonomuraea endophytica]
MDTLPAQLARTKRFTFGTPRHLTVCPDGRTVYFLRSKAGDDPLSCLWALDCATGEERHLNTPGQVVAPRPDPAGRRIAYVSRGALRVNHDGDDHAVAEPDGEEITYGLPEYVAAEEMGRDRGYWWAPDGRSLLVARGDAWVRLVPGLPARTAAGGLVTSADLEDTRRLLLAGHPVTPAGLQLEEVVAIDGETILFTASDEPSQAHLWAYRTDSGLRRLSEEPGVHTGTSAGSTTVVISRTLSHHGPKITARPKGGRAVEIALAQPAHAGPLPSSTAAHPLWLSRSDRAVMSASTILRRLGQVGDTVSRHTHARRSAARSPRSVRLSGAGRRPPSDTVRSAWMISAGVSPDIRRW